CKDGTVIKISDETEAELRWAFEPKKPSYRDSALVVYVNEGKAWPITIKIDKGCTSDDQITRTVKDTKAFINALQEAIEYCEQHGIGI
ncbi:hypothetical protein LCGC14_1321870, partial [marine sediment metagenome]